MSKVEKLLKRFLHKPKDFTFNELETLLSHLGYDEIKKGKTSGSRTAFVNKETMHIIKLHRPHPSPVLKMYQIEEITVELKKKGVIKDEGPFNS